MTKEIAEVVETYIAFDERIKELQVHLDKRNKVFKEDRKTLLLNLDEGEYIFEGKILTVKYGECEKKDR